MRKYHHLGIPTKEKKPGEKYIPHLKIFVSGYDTSQYKIEWMRFEENANFPEVVKTIPHIAFEVDNLYEEIKDKEILIEPNSPTPGITVAFILDNGAPVEFLEIDHSVYKE
ncbi:MAG TPA: hypothetical protein VKA26_10095 [Ignavibacteriaceae bacterium]|nr:hypothetical protein [Ignavibacteriaceae bacterium]